MFKWVHISDIHFCEGTGTDATNMKDRLPECLQKINDANALFITGDFRYAKKDNGNVDSIVEYIDKLCSALKIERDKVFCAPGNHDLERSQKRDRIIESISKDYNPAKGNLTTAQVNELLSGFSFFGDIEKRLYGKCFLAHNTKIHGVKRLDECNIIMLNTAITSGKSGEKEDLILGTQYILDALKDIDPAKPAIMIGHHGHSFLQRKESKKIQNYFKQKKISLYLCGHEHDSCEETVWNGVKQFTAGCICENADASSFRAGFFVGELSDALSVTFTTYKWFPEMEDWKKT